MLLPYQGLSSPPPPREAPGGTLGQLLQGSQRVPELRSVPLCLLKFCPWEAGRGGCLEYTVRASSSPDLCRWPWLRVSEGDPSLSGLVGHIRTCQQKTPNWVPAHRSPLQRGVACLLATLVLHAAISRQSPARLFSS